MFIGSPMNIRVMWPWPTMPLIFISDVALTIIDLLWLYVQLHKFVGYIIIG
jgi:hypothetical protein